MATKATEFRKIMAITPFKIIQGHRFWYQSKAHMRLPKFLLVINPETRGIVLPDADKKLITRWDSERELFYDEIVHALQNNNIYGSIAEVCYHAKIYC